MVQCTDGVAAPFLCWLDETARAPNGAEGEAGGAPGGEPCLMWRSPASAEPRPPSAMRLPLRLIQSVSAGWRTPDGAALPAAPPAMLQECCWSVVATADAAEQPARAPLLLFARDQQTRDAWVAALSSLAGDGSAPGVPTPAHGSTPHPQAAADATRVSERLARARGQGRGGGRPTPSYARPSYERPGAAPQFRPPELTT